MYIHKFLHSFTFPVTISLTKFWANPIAGLIHPPEILPAIEQLAKRAKQTIRVDIELSVVNFALESPKIKICFTLTKDCVNK